MSETKAFEYRPKGGQRPDPSFIERVKSLHTAGYSNVEIGRMVGRHHSNIARLLKKVSTMSVDKVMKEDSGPKARQAYKRATGVQAPATAEPALPSQDTPSQDALADKIARLESELRDIRLERDLYREVIDIAEKRYNVPILKKSGVKQ